MRPSVNFMRNEEVIAPVEARFVRFTILATTGGEPCIDELEVWVGGRNVALSTNGTKGRPSGTLSGFDLHKLEHINDGQYGNNRSWISSEPGKGWVQLEFAKTERIERIVWGRDRDELIKDRLATTYRIEAAVDPNAWQLVASSDDRELFNGKARKPAGPVYNFDGVTIGMRT